MNSNAIHDALSQLLKSPINYVTQFEQNTELFFICIGNHSFFIIDEKLDSVRAEVFFAHVQKLVIDSSPKKYLLIQLTENRDPKVPSKLVMATENRKAISDHLRSAWKADYMFRLGKVADLPIFEGVVSSPVDPERIKKPKFNFTVLTPPMNFEKYNHKKYSFFVPTLLKKINKNDNTFVAIDKENKKRVTHKIFVQVSEEIPLDALNFMEGREDIRVYCEEYAAKLISSQQRYWIMSSKVYAKRWNLNMDNAQWQGWEVHLRTTRKDIIVIMLRRKYIPPLLDYFVDFVVVAEGSDKTATMITEIKPDAKMFKETPEIMGIARKVADSLYANFVTPTLYEGIIQKRTDALFYDEDTLTYLLYRLPNNLHIKPKYLCYGIAFIMCIAKLLMRFVPKQYGSFKPFLEKKYPDEIGAWEENFDLFNPTGSDQVIGALEKKLVHHSTKNAKEGAVNWKFKIARYFAYCVDGGLLNYYFSMNDLIDGYNIAVDKEKEELNKIIMFLLHLRSEKEDYRAPVSIGNRIQDMLNPNEKFVYNSKVMIILLGTSYFKRELSLQDKTLYNKFLMFMFEFTENPFVKNAICRQIIEDQQKQKASSSGGEISLNEVKPVIKPLLYLFHGLNINQATLAAIALSNLCAKSRDIKQYIMEEGADIVISRIDTVEMTLLKYSLMIIQYLMTISQNVAKFVAKGAHFKLMNLLSGSGIVGVWYDDTVLVILLQTLRVIVTNMEELKKEIITANIESLAKIHQCPKEKYKMNVELSMEIMNLCLMVLNDKDIKLTAEIGQKILPYVIKQYKQDLFLSKEQLEKVLVFMYAFKDNADCIKMLVEANIEDKLKENAQVTQRKAGALRQEIIKAKTPKDDGEEEGK